MKRCALFALTFALTCCPCDASAELIFQRTFGINRSINIFDTDRFDLDLSFGDSFFSPTNPVTLFDGTVITPANVNDTLEVTPSDAFFAEAAARLTDGIDDFVHLTFTEDLDSGLVEQRGWHESLFFLGLAKEGVPDLIGATLERIRLQINRFDLISPLQSSSGPPVNLQLTVSIEGTAIPEPGTIWLSLCGIAMLRVTRIRVYPRTSSL